MLIKNSPQIKKAALSLAGIPLLIKLKNSTKNIKEVQHRVLMHIVDSCKDTAFGKEHSFDKIRKIEDYRSAVPVRDFEGHRKYIERMCRGESDVLFKGKPIFYNMTSGTTDKPKLIPVSAEYYNRAYSGISKLWFYTSLRDNPRLFHGKNLSAVSPAVEGTVEDGTTYGSISGVVYKNIPLILRDLYATPYPVICIKDYQKKYYAMMRYSLGCEISYIITANPSTLIQFNRTIIENADDLVRDIRDGTLRKDVLGEIDPSEREKLRSTLKPDASRALKLERLITIWGDKIRPRHYWPNLVCVNTWKQGNCALVLPKIDDYFSSDTALREFGYQASEARAGMVLGNEWNYSLLLANTYQFEFIEENERFSEKPIILGAHELEIGKSYYIIFSNGSGLYRYDINDIIKVKGFYNQFPLFEFIQKGEGVTSLTGEKLSEAHVIKAVTEAASAKNIQVEFYMMYCDQKQFVYKLYTEFKPGTPQKLKLAFADSVDEHLKFINPEYTAKRDSKRLQTPVLLEIKDNSYEMLKSRLLAEGKAREGQYKISCLTKDSIISGILENLRT
jgi:hypothetical protein